MEQQNHFQEYLKETGLKFDQYVEWLLSQDRLIVCRRNAFNERLSIDSRSNEHVTFTVSGAFYKLDLTNKTMVNGIMPNPQYFPILSKTELEKIKQDHSEKIETLAEIVQERPANASANKAYTSFVEIQQSALKIIDEISNFEKQYVSMLQSNHSKMSEVEQARGIAFEIEQKYKQEKSLRISAESKLASFLESYDKLLDSHNQIKKSLEEYQNSNNRKNQLIEENESLKQEIKALKAECYDFAKVKKRLAELEENIDDLKQSSVIN